MFRQKSQYFILPAFILAMGAVAASQGPSNAPAPGTDPDAGTYRIGPGDVLQIDVWKEPDVSNPSVVVRPDGRISLPILGELRAAGLTPLELQKTLSDKLSDLIRGARVTVMVREVNSQRVYVIGEVRREGPVRLMAPLTVLQALAEAGGVTDYAKRSKIHIFRAGTSHKADLRFDYDAVLRGEKRDQNVVLLPGDTIVVPR